MNVRGFSLKEERLIVFQTELRVSLLKNLENGCYNFFFSLSFLIKSSSCLNDYEVAGLRKYGSSISLSKTGLISVTLCS